MTTYRLIDRQGALYFPHGGMPAPAIGAEWVYTGLKDEPKLLLHVYPEGDCDRTPWPLSSDEDRKILACALYGERECNEFFKTPSTIELPDGTEFDFDSWVS